MIPVYRIFLITLIVMAYDAVASAQTVFSVEKISETEYIKAEKESLRYNIIPADTIANNDIVSMVLKESQAKFERLDSASQQEIYSFVDSEGFGFNKQRLIFLPELKLYGFVIPDTPFDDSVWWFDSESGEYICSAASPTAININGTYVSQTGHDCDWPLELRFFRRDGNVIYEFESYKNTQYNGETIFWQEEDSKLSPIFWHTDTMLYLKTYDHQLRGYVYLKIKVQQSIREIQENMMPNGAIRPNPKQ